MSVIHEIAWAIAYVPHKQMPLARAAAVPMAKRLRAALDQPTKGDCLDACERLLAELEDKAT